jgi:hypothetical protein
VGQRTWKARFGALGAMSVAVAVGAAAVTPTLAGASKPVPGGQAQKLKAAELSAVRQLLSHVKVGFHPGAMVEGSVVNGVTKLHSHNWSGYADSGAAKSFTAVSGHWVQPTGTCSGLTESLAAFWVGIDGISSSDPTVEQDGTLILCYLGTPYYVDWWETYPGNAIQVVSQSVKPGDHITAKVSYTGSLYKMSVTDSTTPTGNSFSVSKPCGTTTCENMSAEWIAEAPTSAGSITPLAKFTTWRVTGAHTTYDGTSGTISGVKAPTVDEITIVDTAKKVQAQPSALNSTGSSFSVRWVSAT